MRRYDPDYASIDGAFTAGFDLKELAAPESGTAAEAADNIIARAMEAFEGPIIGAINGHAITGGFALAQLVTLSLLRSRRFRHPCEWVF